MLTTLKFPVGALDKTYGKLQALLLKAATSKPYEEELQFVLSFYASDFDPLLLPTHLQIFSQTFKPDGEVRVMDLLSFFRGCTPGQLDLMSQVSKLVRLLLVMPATNAESERSFSAVRRIKTYLRSTMSQQRLNHLMLLNVHKSHTDDLSLVDIANNFIANNKHRKQFFGPAIRCVLTVEPNSAHTNHYCTEFTLLSYTRTHAHVFYVYYTYIGGEMGVVTWHGREKFFRSLTRALLS